MPPTATPTLADLPRDAMAAWAIRAITDFHAGWDTPIAQFILLAWEDGALRPSTVVAIAGDVPPEAYPAVIAGSTEEALSSLGDRAVPVAALLQVEAFEMNPTWAGMTAADQERVRRASVTQTVHQQPEAVEVCRSDLVDMFGRTWLAQKVRGKGGAPDSEPRVHFLGVGRHDGSTYEPIVAVLRRVTRMLGERHGLLPAGMN